MAATACLPRQAGGVPADPGSRPSVRRPRLAPTLVGATGLAGCITLGLVDPSGGPVLCPFRAATGMYCPGCGSTRMLHHVFTGRFDLAAGDNPFALLMLPLMLWWVFAGTTAWLGGPRWPTPRFSTRQVWGLAAAVGAFWMLRNVSMMPFTLLAPG